MNTSILSRVAAFVTSVGITLVLFQSVAMIGLPSSGGPVLVTQLTPITGSR